MKTKLIKIGALVATFILIFTVAVLPTFASTPLYPITIQNVDFINRGDIGDVSLWIVDEDGNVLYDVTDDYTNSELVNGIGFSASIVEQYKQGDFLLLKLTCQYSKITVNGQTYQAPLAGANVTINESNVTALDIKLITEVPDSDLLRNRIYNFRIDVTGVEYNQGYRAGYTDGKDEGITLGYNDGYQSGYDIGYDDGVDATESSAFGKNLLADTLNAPMNALNQFVLYESTDGYYTITLGSVVGGVIAFSLFIAFLKLFAGG